MGSDQYSVIDLKDVHLPEMVDLRHATQALHNGLFPEIFAANPDDVAVWHELRSYLPRRFALRRRKRFAIGIEENNVLAGYLLYEINAAPLTYEIAAPEHLVVVMDVAVRGERRNSGIARRLLGVLVRRQSAATGRTDIFAHIWCGNEPSRALFETSAFAPVMTVYRRCLNAGDADGA